MLNAHKKTKTKKEAPRAVLYSPCVCVCVCVFFVFLFFFCFFLCSLSSSLSLPLSLFLCAFDFSFFCGAAALLWCILAEHGAEGPGRYQGALMGPPEVRSQSSSASPEAHLPFGFAASCLFFLALLGATHAKYTNNACHHQDKGANHPP